VYCLRDPRSNEVRYVGVTTRDPIARRWQAWRSYGRRAESTLALWFLDLMEANEVPVVEALEVGSVIDAAVMERRWVRRMRRAGNPLCNLNDGGDVNALHPDVRAAARSRLVTPETRAKISAGNKGHTPWNKGVQTGRGGPKGRIMPKEERAARSGREPWNKGQFMPRAICIDCGAQCRGLHSKRCYSCSAVERERLKREAIVK
jgi:hypothetical protein